MAIDKLILTNQSALLKKYRQEGFSLIEKSINAMIAADAKRGIVSKLVYLDDEGIRKYKAAPVSAVSNSRANKNAVDALYRWFAPDYVMLLGSQDIVPHIKLTNLTGDEDGLIIDSDLPYACEHAYSKDGRKFLAPTRVVGRLPDINGGTDVNYLLQLIRNAIAVKPRPRNDYARWFALSTREWIGSSSVSVANLFKELDGLKISPPAQHGTYRNHAKARVHFFNCHGGDKKHVFYGQHLGAYPVSYHSDDVPEKLLPGTFVAAECCYGAQQYAPGDGKLSIAGKYLLNNAAAYVGSTTIAYGPTEGQGSADLLTQYFIMYVLRGHSVGRAFLEARQLFIEDSAPRIDAVELKTLQQFLLLGDPSLHLVNRAHKSLYIENKRLHLEDDSSGRFFRKARRKQLKVQGEEAGSRTAAPKAKSSKIPSDRHREFSKLARQNGIRAFSAMRFDFDGNKNQKGTHYCFVEKKKSKDHRPRVILFRESGNDVDVKVYEQK